MISIVIPTYNEEKYLPKLLNSIKKQKFHDYEIIIADANSADKTVEIAKKYGCKVIAGGRPAVGRNNGARVANGEYLLFLDADVILPKDFLSKALKEFNHKYLEIAPTCQKPVSNLEIDRTIYDIHNYLLKYFHQIYPMTVGVSIFTTKRLHNRIGGFDETMHLNEDNEYGLRAKKIAKYGSITDTYINVSMRRFDKEGRIKLAQKAINQNFYDMLKKIGIDKKVEYEFGNFQKTQNLSDAEKFLEKVLKTFKNKEKK